MTRHGLVATCGRVSDDSDDSDSHSQRYTGTRPGPGQGRRRRRLRAGWAGSGPAGGGVAGVEMRATTWRGVALCGSGGGGGRARGGFDFGARRGRCFSRRLGDRPGGRQCGLDRQLRFPLPGPQIGPAHVNNAKLNSHRLRRRYSPLLDRQPVLRRVDCCSMSAHPHGACGCGVDRFAPLPASRRGSVSRSGCGNSTKPIR